MPKEYIRARAPMRIGLAGGGTDVDPYASEHGGYVFNTTISKYAYSTLRPRRDKKINVSSGYYGRYTAPLDGGPLPLDGNMDLIKAVTNYFNPMEGFDMTIRSDVPAGSGLGGSSTMIVSMIAALATWLDVDMSKSEMSQLAYHLEREVIGLKGGKQDQYAAVYGGFNSLKIDSGGVNVMPANIDQGIINELQCRSVMCFTGLTHDSAKIIETQQATYKTGSSTEALDHTKDIAIQFRSALRHGDLNDCGELLSEAWQYKKQFSGSVSNSEIDRLYNIAVDAGAIGGKVSGAGGGGFMYFICEFDKKLSVAEALGNAGATVSDFMFEPKGVVTWRGDV